MLYAWFGGSTHFVNLVFDYARIRTVVRIDEAFVGALRPHWLLSTAPDRVVGLYALNGLTFLLLLVAWALLAPAQPGWDCPMWLAVAGTQLFLLVRQALKLHFVASPDRSLSAVAGARVVHRRAGAEVAGMPGCWRRSSVGRSGRRIYRELGSLHMVAKGVAMLVPEIDAFRVQFEHLSAEADALVAQLSDKQFTWQPAPDVWSVSLCLDHLNVTARQYLPVMDDGIAEAVRRGLYGPGPYSYNWVGKMMVYFRATDGETTHPIARVFNQRPGDHATT